MKKPAPKRSVAPSNQPQNNNSVQVQQQSWQGPLPPPAALEHFDRVSPGAAQAIVETWIGETRHRQRIEQREQWLFYGDMFFGKVCALLFVIAALGLSAYAAYLGTNWLSAVLAGGTLAAVVGAFVKVQHRNK